MTGPAGPDDLYELLDVPRDASTADITRAYRRQARLLHPDASPGQSDEPERFRAVAAAYYVLGNPARRAAYDQSLGQTLGGQAIRPGPAEPQPSPPPPAPPPAWPPPAWLAPPAFAGGFPAGATLRAGPAWVDPPGGQPDDDRARLAALALLLARHLGATGIPEWPW